MERIILIMFNNFYNMENQSYQTNLPKLPNAVVVLILGIASIVFSCFFVGPVCGIIGLCLSGKGVKMHQTSPNAYSGYGMLNAGRITSIIGLVFGVIYIIMFFVASSLLANFLGNLPLVGGFYENMLDF